MGQAALWKAWRAICPIGAMTLAAPSEIAARGMPKTVQVASSWAMVRAFLGHGQQALGPVRAHAGEQDAHRLGADQFGDRGEQHVDRGHMAGHRLAASQLGVELAGAAHAQMAIIARRQIDVALAQRHVRFGQLDARRAILVERARHGGGKTLVDVLDDHRGRAIDGEIAQQGLECLDPAGRRADRDQARAVDDREARLAGHARGRGRGRRGLARGKAHLGGRADHGGQLVAIAKGAAPAAQFALGEAVDRAERERAGGGIGALLRRARDDDHRGRAQLHDLFEEIEPVHAGHFHVEGDHVGVQLADHLAPFGGIGGGGHDFDVGLAREPVGEDRAHRGRILDNHHADRHAALLS
jgi:hypothetical protein